MYRPMSIPTSLDSLPEMFRSSVSMKSWGSRVRRSAVRRRSDLSDSDENEGNNITKVHKFREITYHHKHNHDPIRSKMCYKTSVFLL